MLCDDMRFQEGFGSRPESHVVLSYPMNMPWHVIPRCICAGDNLPQKILYPSRSPAHHDAQTGDKRGDNLTSPLEHQQVDPATRD